MKPIVVVLLATLAAVVILTYSVNHSFEFTFSRAKLAYIGGNFSRTSEFDKAEYVAIQKSEEVFKACAVPYYIPLIAPINKDELHGVFEIAQSEPAGSFETIYQHWFESDFDPDSLRGASKCIAQLAIFKTAFPEVWEYLKGTSPQSSQFEWFETKSSQ